MLIHQLFLNTINILIIIARWILIIIAQNSFIYQFVFTSYNYFSLSWLYGTYCLFFFSHYLLLSCVSLLISIKKCIFNPYILTFFHFDPYIFILRLLVPKPINAWYLSPYCYPSNRKCWHGRRHSKIIIKKSILALENCHVRI